MPFTAEQDSFILMAHFRSGSLNADGVWSYSLQSCIDQFIQQFHDENIDYDVFKHHKSVLIKRFETKNCICKGKPSGRPTILSAEVVENIQERIQHSPKKSIARLSQETGVSVGSCHKVLKKVLNMHPYKVSVIQRLYPHDYVQRLRYCQWFNEILNNNDLLDLTFFTDEAWFHLSGYVNSQNYREWGTENPHQFIENELHPVKIGIWVAISRRRIIGPIFFNEIINAERYRTTILQQFFEQLHDDELQYGYFQQDGASVHTAFETLGHIQQFYDGRVISRGLWPPRSPDLTPPDFYLFGRLKNSIYKNRLHNLEDLQLAIENNIRSITVEELQRVFDNMKRRVNLCIDAGGEHFQNLL